MLMVRRGQDSLMPHSIRINAPYLDFLRVNRFGGSSISGQGLRCVASYVRVIALLPSMQMITPSYSESAAGHVVLGHTVQDTMHQIGSN